MEFQLTPELLDKIDQYIKGELEGDTLSAFEQELESNEALREEMIIQKRLFDAISHNSSELDLVPNMTDKEIQEKSKNPEYQSVSDKIRATGIEFTQNNPSTKKSMGAKIMRLAPAIAAIFLVVVISTVYLVNNNQSIDQYYYDNVNWHAELISFTEKGDSKNNYASAEKFFEAKNYSKTIEALKDINPEDELYPYGLMYLGASYANLNKDQEALQVFNQLAQMNEFAESSKGLWYAALIHLKLKDEEKAKEVLNAILKDVGNYHYKDAKQILEDLN